MPPGPPGIDEATIRARCATPEAAEYTLYVRRLVAGPGLAGGQAAVLRTATERGILPVGYTRQTLSEHLSGRYRHGPPWSTTEMIIRCLPERAPRERIRAEAASRYQAAAQRAGHRPRSARTVPDHPGPDNHRRPDNPGPDNLRRPDNPGPDNQRRSDSPRGSDSLGTVRRPNASAPGQHGTGSVPGRYGGAGRGRTPNSAPVGTARPDANQPSGQYRRGAAPGGSGRDIAIDIADLRADCARLTVQVLLLGEPDTGPGHPAVELATTLERRRRGPLGQLSQHIEPAAPLPRRALAQYLCAYAELGRTTVTELAVRSGLTAAAVAGILTARRVPTEAELRDLGAVLGVDGEVLWQLATPVLDVRPGVSQPQPQPHR